jgi:hypothetical protein
MAKFKKPKKGPFDDLSSDFKDAVAQSTPEDINNRIAQITKDTEELLAARDEDEDFQSKKALYSEAGAVYRDGKKANRLKTLYCIETLHSKGKA